MLATGFVAMSRPDIQAFLQDVTEALVDMLRSVPFDPTPAAEVGADLVGINLTSTAALNQTIRLLGTELLQAADLPQVGKHHDHLMQLIGALVSGHVAAQRKRLMDEQEMIKKAVFRARDLIEHTRRVSDARWRAAFRSAAAGIAITDLDGVMQAVNPALCEILGQPEDALLGNPLTARLSTVYAAQVLAALDHVARGEHDKFIGDVSFLSQDGEQVWARLALARDTGEAPEYAVTVVAVVEDISDPHLRE
jgi:PAS domain S-box-containing protein